MLEMLDRTNDTDCPWSIVEGNDKRRARLNCIHHLLSRIPFTEVPQEELTLPERVFDPEYERRTRPLGLYIPSVYG